MRETATPDDPNGFPTRVGGVQLEEAISSDDAVGRAKDGSPTWVAFGRPQDLEVERAMIERLSRERAELFSIDRVISRGADARGTGHLALGQLYDATSLTALEHQHAPFVVPLFAKIVELLAVIEAGGDFFTPEGFDFAIVDGAPRLRRMRGARRAHEGERIDARTAIELAGEQLPEVVLARLPARVLSVILPHRERPGDAQRSVDTMRAALAELSRAQPPASEDEATLAVRRHIGLIRERNEDAAASAQLPDRSILVVCDGVSASFRADVASSLVARTVSERLSIARPSKETMAEAIRSAHQSLLEENRSYGGEPMGTTVVAACVHGRGVTLGWVGDSRAYWVDRERSLALTRDHSWVEEVVAAGLASLEDALVSPLAHALTRCLGPMPGAEDNAHAEPEVADRESFSGGYLILCSDGLWNYFGTPQELADSIADLLDDAPAHAVAERLLSTALARGGHDNVTVAVLRK